jgi:5-methylcytosine-specific restriction endonuclease McrA
MVAPGIKGVEGKPGDVQGTCAAPGCSSPAQQRHHMWPRSFLKGDYEWVEVEGAVVQNTIGLCVACHQAVTGGIGGHRAHIRYDSERGLFEWWARGAEGDDGPQWFHVGHVKRKGLVDAQPEAKRIRRQEGLCPECGRPLRDHAKHDAPGPRRKVSTWGVVVPADGEVGSDVMDDWVDEFSTLLGFGEAPARLKRYHVIAVVFAWAAMNKEQFLSDLEEADWFARD